MHFAYLANTLLKDEESARDNHVLDCNYAKYTPIKKITHKLSNNLFFVWLLITPPRLKYVAIIPCNLSLMSCFAHVNVSKGSVATHARCGGIFYIHLTAKIYQGIFQSSEIVFLNRLRFDRIMATSLWPRFFLAQLVDPTTEQRCWYIK